MKAFFTAGRGELDPFVLVVEGSIPNEKIAGSGYFSGFGNKPGTDQPMTFSDWIDLLAPKAWRFSPPERARRTAAFTLWRAIRRARWGFSIIWVGIGNRSAGIPIVCVPGCPIQPDNLSETILYLLWQANGRAPMIPLDEAGRPTWLFGNTVHEGCDRAGYYEQGEFATEYDSPTCLVKIGCWGPVVKCNVPKRGWMGGVGGCPNVGGICIGCTMPGFPDKFMPFMDEPPGAKVSTNVIGLYGNAIGRCAASPQSTADKEPKWRHKGAKLTTGYQPRSPR